MKNTEFRLDGIGGMLMPFSALFEFRRCAESKYGAAERDLRTPV